MSNLSIEHVSFSYPNNRLVLHDINMSIEAGEAVGLIGPNGSGKTTLLKLASGVLHPTIGKVLLENLNLNWLSRNKIAQRVAVVPQQFHVPFAFTVGEIVMLGRTPFIKLMSGEKEQDQQIVQHTMELTGIIDIEKRVFNELSGGERQKAILALAMAQQPRLLLLDEPTTHLDINHQIELLHLVKNLNHEQGVTVVAAMHDLNLAALYFDRLILLKNGSVFADGSPPDLLTKNIIEEVYSTTVQVTQHPTAKTPYVIILPKKNTASLQ